MIMVTGTGNERIAVEAIKLGAGDYLVKDVEGGYLDLLPTVIERVLQQQRLVEERRQAVEALRESEARYRGLFDRVPVGLYRSTPQGQIVDANPALVAMLGYPSREALMAEKATELYVDVEDRRQLQVLLEGVGVVRDFETQMRRHDGAASGCGKALGLSVMLCTYSRKASRPSLVRRSMVRGFLPLNSFSTSM